LSPVCDIGFFPKVDLAGCLLAARDHRLNQWVTRDELAALASFFLVGDAWHPTDRRFRVRPSPDGAPRSSTGIVRRVRKVVIDQLGKRPGGRGKRTTGDAASANFSRRRAAGTRTPTSPGELDRSITSSIYRPSARVRDRDRPGRVAGPRPTTVVREQSDGLRRSPAPIVDWRPRARTSAEGRAASAPPAKRRPTQDIGTVVRIRDDWRRRRRHGNGRMRLPVQSPAVSRSLNRTNGWTSADPPTGSVTG